MTIHYTITLDVGPTFVRSAHLDEKGRIVEDSCSIFPSKLSRSQEEILAQFVKIIQFNINSILMPDFDIIKIRFSVSKFFEVEDSYLYYMGNELRNKLSAIPSINSKLNINYQIYIEWEATLFAVEENILSLPETQTEQSITL